MLCLSRQRKENPDRKKDPSFYWNVSAVLGCWRNVRYLLLLLIFSSGWPEKNSTGIPIGGKTGRRGSRPFLSPDAPPAATLMAALQTHRDSLSPDSAAEEALSGGAGLLGSTSKLRGRRDSRPHLSPDGECGGDGTSPRGSRIRRQSTTTEDIFKWVFSFSQFLFDFRPIVLYLFLFPFVFPQFYTQFFPVILIDLLPVSSPFS